MNPSAGGDEICVVQKLLYSASVRKSAAAVGSAEYTRLTTLNAFRNNEVHIWNIPLNASDDDIHRLGKLLDEQEWARARRFVFPSHRRRFIACRGRLRVLLGYYIDEPPARIALEANPYGKLQLAGGQKKAELKFNLSHCEDLAVFAFAFSREVGVDIERVYYSEELDGIAKSCFSEDEYLTFSRLPKETAGQAFFNCWTRKEAYIKAIGEGLSFPLRQFSVSLLPGHPAKLLGVKGRPEETRRWSMYSFSPAPGYAAAITYGKTRLHPEKHSTGSQ